MAHSVAFSTEVVAAWAFPCQAPSSPLRHGVWEAQGLLFLLPSSPPLLESRTGPGRNTRRTTTATTTSGGTMATLLGCTFGHLKLIDHHLGLKVLALVMGNAPEAVEEVHHFEEVCIVALVIITLRLDASSKSSLCEDCGLCPSSPRALDAPSSWGAKTLLHTTAAPRPQVLPLEEGDEGEEEEELKSREPLRHVLWTRATAEFTILGMMATRREDGWVHRNAFCSLFGDVLAYAN